MPVGAEAIGLMGENASKENVERLVGAIRQELP